MFSTDKIMPTRIANKPQGSAKHEDSILRNFAFFFKQKSIGWRGHWKGNFKAEYFKYISVLKNSFVIGAARLDEW